MSRTIRLDLAYDGTNYAGWQIQENAVTVESRLREALDAIKSDYRDLAASGRTDSGVHAKALTVSFVTESRIPGEAYKKALNTALPQDIVVKESREVEDFHARYSALGKHYSYHLSLSETPDPFNYRYVWHYPYEIDVERVVEACEFLTGRHDYAAFRKVGSSVKTTEREVYAIVPHFRGDRLILDFIGNGFLYNMVRILTGTIIEYASGRIERDQLERVFREPKRENAGITAPAQGLFLEKVFYDREELEERVEDLKSGRFRT